MIRKPESVTIHVRTSASQKARLGDNSSPDMLQDKYKIGSAFKAGTSSVLRALTFEEERKFLPTIIGVDPSHPEWNTRTTDYWKNITKTIPVTTGLTLEVGMMYTNKEDADKAEKEAEQESNKLAEARAQGKRYDEIFDVRTSLGVPINVEDYILYRHALVYSRVANHIDDIWKSSKIDFYIHSERRERAARHKSLGLRKEAMALYLELITDRAKTDNVLVMLKEDIQNYNLDINNEVKLKTDDDAEIDLTLERIASTSPGKFIATVKDKKLNDKSFIERCINAGDLKRLPNTETIMYGDNTTLGYNLIEAIAFLNDDKNKEIKKTLEARLKALKK